MTFVDYRAQKRLQRFFELSEGATEHGHLQDIARQAGFGSYSQFHRVHTRLIGKAPRAHQRRQRSD
jgi:methylphosphotriester-DNA--protein-cysteine methyltransferase